MKYAPGLMVGQLSGKAGSTVASRNRNGSYFRTRVSPMLVRNPATEAVRASFTQNSQGYRGLTATQIQGWISLGAGITRSNSIGQPYTLTGLQAYQSVNRNLSTVGLDSLDTAPQQIAPQAPTAIELDLQSPSDTPDTTVTVGAASATQQVGDTSAMQVGDNLWFVTANASRDIDSITDATHVVLSSTITTTTAEDVIINKNGLIRIEFEPTPVPADTYFAVFATLPQSPGITRPTKNAYKLIYVIPPAGTGPYNLNSAYAAIGGSVPLGGKLFMQMVAINSNGFRSTPIETVETAYRP